MALRLRFRDDNADSELDDILDLYFSEECENRFKGLGDDSHSSLESRYPLCSGRVADRLNFPIP